jgi:hypothetical protein
MDFGGCNGRVVAARNLTKHSRSRLRGHTYMYIYNDMYVFSVTVQTIPEGIAARMLLNFRKLCEKLLVMLVMLVMDHGVDGRTISLSLLFSLSEEKSHSFTTPQLLSLKRKEKRKTP